VKQLTLNQMFARDRPPVSGPLPTDPTDLHQLVHQRLWTTTHILGPNPKIRPDHGLIRTS